MSKYSSGGILTGTFLSAIFLFWGFFSSAPKAEAAPQVPPGCQVIGTMSGDWKFKYAADATSTQVPSVNFKTADYLLADITFVPQDYVTKWDLKNDPSFRPQIAAKIALTPKIFECNGLPFKLWFEDGETLELGSFKCEGNRLLTGTSGEDKAEQDEREEALSRFLIKRHHPIAITQGRAALLWDYPLGQDFQRFQKEVNPSLNPAYFKEARQKWNEDIRAGTKGLKIDFQE